MADISRLWKSITNKNKSEESVTEPQSPEMKSQATFMDLDIPPNDPLLLYCQQNPRVVDLDQLLIDSPTIRTLRESGVKLIVPLVSQGELIGMINLGSRLSEQEYSTDDRKLLDDLATQAAPAVRVAQLARQQQAEAREIERMEQELHVARLIQQTLLPQELPDVPGYEVAAYYQPAREVGGDFYDFFYFEDGRIGFIIGDVTDKGVPAALVMATTRTLLRAASERLTAPGQVLERVNDLLYPDIPSRMFVTCLYAVLDPETGHLQYANAGHDLPYCRREDSVDELRATGMPLGLMPGMTYEEKKIVVESGETVLFYSDGLAEAHDPQGEMFGFPRLQALMAEHPGGAHLVDYMLEKLTDFTGPHWEQEDDVTLMTLRRRADTVAGSSINGQELAAGDWEKIAELEIASRPGNERQAMEQVSSSLRELEIPAGRLEKLKTAVAEATMNAMEHGNQYQEDVPVQIEVLKSDGAIAVRITDQGRGQLIPQSETPDLEAKLAGEQSPRGWGLYLIQNMVDELNIDFGENHHTMELIFYLTEGESYEPSP